MGLAEKLQERLAGGKFRMLNEKLYKQKELTKKEADKYHEYYKQQVSKWPTDPRKTLADLLKTAHSGAKIADIGCGTAELAGILPNVTSFDKYPAKDFIIKAEIDKVPADKHSFNVAVHCLSLMVSCVGTVVLEANRILAPNGTWYIVEVRSRIINMKTFISKVEKMGFKLKNLDLKNTHFVIFSFEKTTDCEIYGKIPEITLKPCLYKKR